MQINFAILSILPRRQNLPYLASHHLSKSPKPPLQKIIAQQSGYLKGIPSHSFGMLSFATKSQIWVKIAAGVMGRR